MSMLESIEKLRGEIRDDLERTCGSSTSVRSERVLSSLDEIEREISSRYMLLPVDADGVPIRIGMRVINPYGEQFIVDSLYINSNTCRVSEKYSEIKWLADSCRIKRTVEDVLRKFAEEVNGCRDTSELLAKYTDELRELMGGES